MIDSLIALSLLSFNSQSDKNIKIVFLLSRLEDSNWYVSFWTICCETGSWTVVGVPSTTPHLPNQHHHHHHHLWQLLLDHHFWQKYEDSHLRWFLIRLWMIYDQIWWKYIWEKLAYDSCPDMIISIVIITIIVILSFHRSGSVRNDDTFFFSSPSHLFFLITLPRPFPCDSEYYSVKHKRDIWVDWLLVRRVPNWTEWEGQDCPLSAFLRERAGAPI